MTEVPHCGHARHSAATGAPPGGMLRTSLTSGANLSRKISGLGVSGLGRGWRGAAGPAAGPGR